MPNTELERSWENTQGLFSPLLHRGFEANTGLSRERGSPTETGGEAGGLQSFMPETDLRTLNYLRRTEEATGRV